MLDQPAKFIIASKTMEKYQYLEIVGLLLILISVGWELFLATTLDSIEKNIQTKRLHEKLDQLHHRQYQLQKHLETKLVELKSNIKSEHELDFPGTPLSDRWNPSPYDAADEQVQRVVRQAKFFRNVKASLFIVGTSFLLVAKVIEYRSQPREIKPCIPTARSQQRTYEAPTVNPLLIARRIPV